MAADLALQCFDVDELVSLAAQLLSDHRRLRRHAEKVRERAEAIRRARKLARKKMQREGLLPATKSRVERAGGGRAGPTRISRFGS